MKSFKQMVKDGEIKRADAMKVLLSDIHEEPGFNLRREGEDLQQSIDALCEFILDGGQLPPLEVRPREEGGVWLVDGHRRSRALRQAVELGYPAADEDGKLWVHVVAFTGNDADRVARVITSQEGRKLEPLELAEGYKRLASFGWDAERIAKKVGKTRQHVDQMLTLGNANTDVQRMVAEGTVAAATAVELVREHGEGAGKVLAGELEKAKAAGKAKVTAGTMKGATVPRNLLDDLHEATTRLHSSLPMDDRLQIERFHKGEIYEGSIPIPLEHLMHLHLILEEAQRVLADKELKAVEKANKAKQQSLEGVE